ncbi:MAG TPA: enoyl-CoA hydratase/isomerase family protein [Bacteriovoracaceae bacterium]|nr:enoyl-CoA hydratase/isomerase family protein [Bacteriovoracaceae bacterium]
MHLFNYTTLSTRLEKTTRTLFVTLNRPDWNNAFRLEMLFELESLLAWCTTRVEINSIYIESSSKIFSTGLELNHLSELSASSLSKINAKLQKIIFAMMQLPQTIVVDLGHGSQTLASEFALGADIRIAHQNTRIAFNHNHYGLSPAAGGMSMLSTLVAPSFARHWILSGNNISTDALKNSGFIGETYNDHNHDEVRSHILNSIAKDAPVQRIQTKLGLFESLRSQFEAGIVNDRKIAKASMMSEDWKSKAPQEENFDFMPAKSMSYTVKLSLIKNEENLIEH